MAKVIDKVEELEEKEEGILSEVEEVVEEGVEAVEEVVEQVTKSPTSSKQSDDSSMKELTGKELEKAAEKESVETEDIEAKGSETKSQVSSADIIERKKALLEKAAKLKEKIDVASSEELKEQVKIKKRTDMLIPLEDYVKAGIYLGTKVVTPDMKPFVYRRRADGLAIFNTDTIDEKLKDGVGSLAKFNPEDVILVCKRQAGWKAAEKFSELTGIRIFTKKYPAGVLTNTSLPDFFENELTVVMDQWLDKNALNDTLKVGKKVLMVCDTNNFSKGANQVIIGNNKSPKSLGVIFYILTRGYLKARGEDTSKVPDLEWWTGELDQSEAGASKGV